MKKNTMPAGRQGFAPLIILILIAVILAGGYFFVKSGLKISMSPDIPSSPSQPTVSVAPISEGLFTGKLTKLSQDFGLLKKDLTEDDKFIYYSAGFFESGNLAGYTRIIAVDSPSAMGAAPIYTLATKDFKTFVLDDPDSSVTKFSEDDWQNPYYFLDKSKVISTTTFDTYQPESVPLDKNFSLYKDDFWVTPLSDSGVEIRTDFTGFQILPSPNKNLTMYFQSEANPVNKYVLGDTKIIVVDSTGLPVVYSLTTPKNISEYPSKKAEYDVAEQKYEKDQSQAGSFPPNTVFPPHLGFAGSDISNSSDLSFYKDYETAFPGPCAEALDTRVVNINDSDLKQIGMFGGIAVFVPKDPSSDLNNLEYQDKIGVYNDPTSGYSFAEANPGMAKPASLADYSKNNPLLFIKDYWGRWIALGEWDINLPGGCGKPVIYLYPPKDTKVTLRFNAPVNFTTDIPTYTDYWQVLAHKDGSLTNLRPDLTDCSKIDFSKVGSEYAKDACRTNTYPYLYWSGNIASTDYPKVSEGWIVAKSDLQNFIDTKLQYMGLTEKERNDFESYWIPEMSLKNSLFYRISFLTTSQVDQIFPMTVTPNPDSILRIFMDWQPLSQKPVSPIAPEILPQLTRNGFTMVEWGGLKLP